jgi:hypothetical protein
MDTCRGARCLRYLSRCHFFNCFNDPETGGHESCDYMNARESLSAIPQRILRYQYCTEKSDAVLGLKRTSPIGPRVTPTSDPIRTVSSQYGCATRFSPIFF